MSPGERRTGPLPPDFLILGAQKCGTSSLAAALRSHPQVFLPAAKEAHHFGRVPDRVVGGRSYRRFFDGWEGQPVVGEATPEYLALPRAAEQICRSLPKVRTIVVLRNPVDRAYSAYWQGHRVGWCRSSFAEEVAAELASDHVRPIEAAYSHLLQRGRYAEQLQRYLDLGLDRDRLLVLFMEVLLDDEEAALASVQRFLGIEPVLTSLPNANRALRIDLPLVARRTLHRFRRTRLGRAVRNRFSRPFQPPPMDSEVRARLVEYYRPHNARLAELLGRELPHWDR